MKTYRVPVTYQCRGYVTITAESMEDIDDAIDTQDREDPYTEDDIEEREVELGSLQWSWAEAVEVPQAS